MWWAEIEDADLEMIRAVYSSNADTFCAYTESMLWYVDLTLDDIAWSPVDDSAKKFLNRARKLHENGSQSEQDTSEEEGDDDGPTES